MQYKKIKDQIANQTRADIGFVKTNNSSGFNVNNAKLESVPPKEARPFMWKRISYIHYRGKNDHIIPILTGINTKELFSDKYPDFTYLKEYYDWNDYSPFNGQLPDDFESSLLDGGLTGYFADDNITDKSNVTYLIQIKNSRANNPKNQIKDIIPFQIYGQDIGMSIWVKETNINSNELTLLYDSGIDGINDWAYLNLSVGHQSSTLIILAYVAHSTKKKGLAKRIPLDARIQDVTTPYTGVEPAGAVKNINYKRIVCNVDFTKRKSNYISQGELINNDGQPTWGEVPVESTVDPFTGNVVNQLNFGDSRYSNYKSFLVYRRTYNDNIPILSYLDDSKYGDNLLISTSNVNIFKPGDYAYINNTLERLGGSLSCPANKIANGDFAWYQGTSTVRSWEQLSTATEAVNFYTTSSYPYRGDYRYNGNCLRMTALKTDTTKSYYIEMSTSFSVSTSDSLSFYYNKVSGENTSKIKLLYYTDNLGNYSSELSSAVYGNKLHNNVYISEDTVDSSRNWRRFSTKFNQIDSALSSFEALYLPADCTHAKLRFYSSYESTSASVQLVDGFHIGKLSADYIFSTSNSNQIAVQLYDNFENQRNLQTTFNAYYNATSNSIHGLNADSVIGRLQYVDSSNWNGYVKFDYGVKFTDSATNYLANGDFSGGDRFWSSSVGFNYVDTAITTPFGSRCANFFSGNNTALAYLEQSTSSVGLVVNSAWCFSIWAKCHIDSMPIRLSIHDNRASESSATCYLSTVWAKYEHSHLFTTDGGDTVNARIVVPKGTIWNMKVAGAQLEAKKHIVDFNLYDTTQSSFSAKDGLRYSTPAFDDYYGTIRFWYTPLLMSHYLRDDTSISTACTYNGLAFWGQTDDSSYKSIYWDNKNAQFHFRQYDGTNYHIAKSPIMTYSSGEPIHIVATWDSSNSYLYVDNFKSTASVNTVTSAGATNFYIGIHAPNKSSSFSANGIIQNVRIDSLTWTPNRVDDDYNATRTLYSDNIIAKSVVNTFIGEKKANWQDSLPVFTDDNGLQNNTKYEYVFRAIDENGKPTIFSSSKSIYTKRKNFEKDFYNKVTNSSFEVLDNNNVPLFWSTCGASDGLKSIIIVDNTFSHSGNTSIRGYGLTQLFGGVKSDYIEINDTSISHYVSWYMAGQGLEYSALYLYMYDSSFNSVGTRKFSSQFSTSSSTISKDGNYWVRYSTAISSSNITYSTVSSTKYWKIACGSRFPGAIFYVDSIQVEENQLRDYSESSFIKENNLGYKSISGSVIKDSTLFGKQFKTGKIGISTNPLDANNLVIGEIRADSSYSVMDGQGISYHLAGMPTANAFQYTKHVESGNAIFDTTIPFNYRYTDWNGNPISPHTIITPSTMKIYVSTTGTVENQSLKILKEVTASGMTVNAFLTKADDIYHESIGGDGMYVIPDDFYSGFHSSRLYATANSGPNTGCTALAVQCKSESGKFSFYQHCTNQYGNPYDVNGRYFNMSFYATSDVTTACSIDDLVTWNILSYRNYPCLYNPTYSITTSEYWNSGSFNARTIAYYLYPFSEGIKIEIRPLSLEYNDAEWIVLDSGSGIGSFYYTVIDGGEQG